MMNTRYDNDLTDHANAFYAKNDIELLWPLDRVRCVMKTRQDNDMTDCTGATYIFILLNFRAQSDWVPIVTNRTDVVYAENETKLLWSIRPGSIYEKNQIRQQCD